MKKKIKIAIYSASFITFFSLAIITIYTLFIIASSVAALDFDVLKGKAVIEAHGDMPIPNDVMDYYKIVMDEAQKINREVYVPLFLAVMTQESHGKGTDVFQCSKYLEAKGKPLTVRNSIWGGVNCMSEKLDEAGVSGPVDFDGIKLALQAYNYGSAYIAFARENGGKWTQENADEFARIQSKDTKRANGTWAYGDQYYAEHVLQYYSYTEITDSSFADVVSIAQTKIGCKYVWGASGPNKFDCSGFVYWCFNEAGYALPRCTADDIKNKYCTIIDSSELQPGDLIFYTHPGESAAHHVAIYFGSEQIIHAKDSKHGVVYDPLNYGLADIREYGRINIVK